MRVDKASPFPACYYREAVAHHSPGQAAQPRHPWVRELFYPPPGRVARNERGGSPPIPAVSDDDHRIRPPRALGPDPSRREGEFCQPISQISFLWGQNASQRCPKGVLQRTKVVQPLQGWGFVFATQGALRGCAGELTLGYVI